MNRRDALYAVAAGLTGVPAFALPSMLTRRVPSSGEMLPVIGLGTWQTFDVGHKPSDRAELELVLKEFVALGGRVLDSSPMYGSAEQVAGDLMAQLGVRKKMFVATKVWSSDKAAGMRQMEESMARLRARPIDLMQVHNMQDVEMHLETLREWKRRGLVRYIGVTHYTASEHETMARLIASEAVDFIQINYSAGERQAEQHLLPLARERGVAVLANRPFVGGDVFRRVRSKPLPAWAGEIDCTSWAQLLLKFVVSHPAVTCAIPATSKLEHLRDNMQAGVGRMPDEKQRVRIVRLLTS
ncbi:aldo/keto reductase [Massilia sp. CF038]|uniref:aldo/keto reductase n=1 Tax=Massilia sp. CF038 TaxID=1881045 RepID=UPI0009225D07|nr:aldo/keto reductase [Massilia sp. CF038]SHG40207.1 Aldo/keto reductase [Massilia sp. CF038]